MKLCRRPLSVNCCCNCSNTTSSIVTFLLILLLFIGYDGTHHAVDAKPNFLNFFRSPNNYQPAEYQQPYAPIIERSHHFEPQTDDKYAWDDLDRNHRRRQPHQHQRHHEQTNGKERYNEICRVIHGIDRCY